MPIGMPDADGLMGTLMAGSAAALTNVVKTADERGPAGSPSIAFG